MMNRWLLIGVLALLSSGFVQRYVEKERVAANLVWTDPENKQALESGFLALGGFRGVLADLLWIRAIGHQDKGRYYELKLLCDLLQKLQPTFVQVHAFQAYNMSYNLAFHAENCDEMWYWIRSGIASLEKGLERNKRNHVLWFELGYQYFDRLSDVKLGEKCKHIRTRELPRLDDLNESQRERVFLGEKTWEAGRARYDENLRFAAYYFWKSMQTGTDLRPLRTERIFGQCIQHLGHFASRKPPAERHNWDDWGAEDWWVELRRRNVERGDPHEETVPDALLFCVYEEMDFYDRQAKKSAAAGKSDEAAAFEKQVQDAYTRCRRYFPEDQRTLEQMLNEYRAYLARVQHLKQH